MLLTSYARILAINSRELKIIVILLLSCYTSLFYLIPLLLFYFILLFLFSIYNCIMFIASEEQLCTSN